MGRVGFGESLPKRESKKMRETDRESERDRETEMQSLCPDVTEVGAPGTHTHTITHTHAHWLWQDPCPVPASCAKTPAGLAKRGSHKKTHHPLLWPSGLPSYLLHSLLFWLLHISCSLPLISPAPFFFPPLHHYSSWGLSSFLA